jgi:hypothetical protein
VATEVTFINTISPIIPDFNKKVKRKWTLVHQEAFDQMKVLIAKEALVTFPDFSKEFKIHMEAKVCYN